MLYQYRGNSAIIVEFSAHYTARNDDDVTIPRHTIPYHFEYRFTSIYAYAFCTKSMACNIIPASFVS